MKSHRFGLLFICLCVAGSIFLAGVIWAQIGERSERILLARLDALIKKMNMIQTEQQKMLQSQEASIQEIKNLKIWVNKRR